MKFLKALIAVLALAGFLFAQDAAPKTEQVNSAMKIHGKIIKIDVKTGMIIVKSKTEKDTMFVDSTATLISGDKVVKLSDFKKGANVNVTWEVIKGKKNATKIDEKIKGGSEKENY
jgi:Cu/Ag efflux protein CusF